jgi:D-arginine dehydrogenase
LERAQVVIVGGGLAGLAVARHLGRRALVLDQGSGPGREASAQNVGMVRLAVEDPYERRLALRSQEHLSDPAFATAVRTTGALIGLAYDPFHLDDAVAHLRAHGSRIDALSSPADVSPLLRGASLRRAWWFDDARVVDAPALVALLARPLAIRSAARVERLVIEGGRIAGVATSAGPIACDAVVLAAGAWCGELAAGAGLERPLIAIRRSAFAWSGGPGEGPWVWIDDAGVYVRPDRDGWSASPCDETPEHVAEGPGSLRAARPDALALLQSKLAEFLPAVDASAAPVRAWSGLRTFAPDRRPLLGPDGAVDGLHWAAGLGGYGVTTALGVGEAVAGWLDGADVAWLDRSGVRPDRAFPRRVPYLPDGALGRAAVLDVAPFEKSGAA